MAVVPPISMSTTFKQDGPAQFRSYEYGRSGNPTRNTLEKVLASLEGAKYGMAFSSGLGASTSIVHLLSAGDHIVSMDDLYGGTNRYLRKVADRMNIKTTFVDATVPENVEKAIQENTRLVWIETPTNPTLKVVDIQRVAELVHKKDNILLVVDNTFLSSYFQRPLELGADIVMHSLTKYMNGHSDVIMGAAMTNNEDVHTRLRFLQNSIGPVPSPFDCYLETHPCVERVIHPGLPSHPQHELFKRQCYGHSGMVTMYIKGGLDEAKAFFKSLKVFTLAESLGGYESLAELPALMTHASVSPEERAVLGISD